MGREIKRTVEMRSIANNGNKARRPYVCFEIEPGAGLFITYAAMARISGASISLLANRINKTGKTPLQAVQQGCARKRKCHTSRQPAAPKKKIVHKVSWRDRTEACYQTKDERLVQCKNYNEWAEPDNNYQCPCKKGFEWPDKYVRRVA